MPTVKVRDLEMYYEIHGAGPRLLNISGTGNDLRRSMPAQFPLNENFTVLHYDQRGLGQTSSGKRAPSMADFADDAAALLEVVGWDRCHVVGTSFGGMVAQHVAIRHPDLVDRMVLNCTSPGGSQSSYPVHELEALSGEARAEAWLRVLDDRYDPDAEEPIPGLGPFLEVLRAQLAADLDEDAALGLQRQLEARRHHDVEDALSEVTALTLVCAGRYDCIAPVMNSEAIAERLPNGSLSVFDGGHPFMFQDPDAFARTAAFLAIDMRARISAGSVGGHGSS